MDGELVVVRSGDRLVFNYRPDFVSEDNLRQRSVPTHTEDGIPIRKLYVANLPPSTTRMELFGLFAHYGFIKSCWLKMGESAQNSRLAFSPAYAFVTFSDPADAHRALVAPTHERILRGRTLRVSPADSWHQPGEDADGSVRWRRRVDAHAHPEEEASGAPEGPGAEGESAGGDGASDDRHAYTIMDVLNRDCLAHVMSYVPLQDLIRTERVSKRWRDLLHDYFHGVRTFKTSWWEHNVVTLTTAVLRHVLLRLGPSLARLHVDHHWSALNDRTAHTIGKFCPSLDDLKIVGMITKNWNPVIYSCKQLKSIIFASCSKLTDTSLVPVVGQDSSVESLAVSANSHVTGLFLASMKQPGLRSLHFRACESLQGVVLATAALNLPALRCLKLELCPANVWKTVPKILENLTKLEELSLSELRSMEYDAALNEAVGEAVGRLAELRTLRLCRNDYIGDALVKRVAEGCTKLRSLDVSACHAANGGSHKGVTDEGLKAIGRHCAELEALDASYLPGVTDAGVAALAGCARLRRLAVRRNRALTDAPLVECVRACRQLEEVDACGCEEVTEGLVKPCIEAVAMRPGVLKLWLAQTAAAFNISELPSHEPVQVDVSTDRSDLDWMQGLVSVSETESDVYSDDPYELDYDDRFSDSGDVYIDEEDFDEQYEDAMFRAEFDFAFI